MAKKTIYNVVNSVKGGCGKTTFSVYLAWKAANAATKKNTLLIDMDFQGTAMEFLFHAYETVPSFRKTYRFFAIFATFSQIFRFFLKLYHYG